MIKECEYCGEPIEKGESVYQAMVYTKEGKQEFIKTCSERCAKKCKDKSYEIHSEMAGEVIRCSIQKFSNTDDWF